MRAQWQRRESSLGRRRSIAGASDRWVRWQSLTSRCTGYTAVGQRVLHKLKAVWRSHIGGTAGRAVGEPCAPRQLRRMEPAGEGVGGTRAADGPASRDSSGGGGRSRLAEERATSIRSERLGSCSRRFEISQGAWRSKWLQMRWKRQTRCRSVGQQWRSRKRLLGRWAHAARITPHHARQKRQVRWLCLRTWCVLRLRTPRVCHHE